MCTRTRIGSRAAIGGVIRVATVLITVLCVLAGLLLAYTTYAAIFGISGTFTRARYEHCPRCHHHYLAGRRRRPHACPHGVEQRLYETGWAWLHHTGSAATPAARPAAKR
jgi:hypothetical protein